MKTNEFCYWLQGLYELQQPDELSRQQLSLIKGHLRLVIETEGKLLGFPLWLDGFFKGIDLEHGELISLTKKPTHLIGDELAKYFQCVIDHSYEKSADELRSQHPVIDGTLLGIKFNC